MRDIKFRIWDKALKKYMKLKEYQDLHAIEVETDGTLILSPRYRFMDSMMIQTDAFDVQQFTGLHDKNEREIYEGDIVSKETFDDTKPNYRDISYAKVVWIEELASYHLVNKDDKILWNLASDKYNIEVAGNIYENSDLLKGADNIE